MSPIWAQWPLSGSNEDKDFTLGFCFLIISTQPQHRCWLLTINTQHRPQTILIAHSNQTYSHFTVKYLLEFMFLNKIRIVEQKEPFWHKAANVLVTSIELGIVGDNISPSPASSQYSRGEAPASCRWTVETQRQKDPPLSGILPCTFQMFNIEIQCQL